MTLFCQSCFLQHYKVAYVHKSGKVDSLTHAVQHSLPELRAKFNFKSYSTKHLAYYLWTLCINLRFKAINETAVTYLLSSNGKRQTQHQSSLPCSYNITQIVSRTTSDVRKTNKCMLDKVKKTTVTAAARGNGITADFL